ncbi:MAG: spore cortex biosynthesis protein YabQ [Clostridia bacterium]|nr:spore cortex biosynthesis protein YabQ [Clostridia bacterium]
MEIYPELQFAMLLGAFLGGVCLGGVWELFCASRILFGAYEPPPFMRARYACLLPLLRRPVPFERKGVSRRLWRSIVIGLCDVLFCLLFAVFIILLLYRYNDGAFRFSVPMLSLVGFALFRTVSSRWLSLAEAYLAYGIAAASLYLAALLALPPKGMKYLFGRFVLRPAREAYRRLALRCMRRRSAELCAMQLKWAECGFEGECPKAPKKKGRMRYEKKDRGQDNTHAMGDPHPHSGHIRGGSRHRRKSLDGMESASPAGRRASAGKRVVSK